MPSVVESNFIPDAYHAFLNARREHRVARTFRAMAFALFDHAASKGEPVAGWIVNLCRRHAAEAKRTRRKRREMARRLVVRVQP